MSNSVVVVGNIVREDPVLRFTSTGKAMVTFTVCDSRKPSADAEFVNTYWNCVGYEDLALQIAENVSKGTRVRVEGRFEERPYKDKSGVERMGFSLVLFSATVALPKAATANTAAAPAVSDAEDLF